MNNEWGLTERGFRRPTYPELLDALEYRARELWGTSANLTVRSPIGIFLRIFAWMLNILFQISEDVYNSRFVDTAVGAALYNAGRIIGLRLLSAQKASGYLLIEGRPGATVPEGFLSQTVAGIQFVVVTQMRIGEDGTILVPAQAVKPGPEGNVEANTIHEIVNPPGGDDITSVTNPKKMEGGAVRETDELYRDRYYKSVDFAGGVNGDAIRAELLQNVEGIVSAEVYENYTDHWDLTYNLPPHSFEAVVYGGLDSDVAVRLHKRRALGIEPYGNTMVPVINASGRAVETYFSRPTPVAVWVKIENLVTNSTFSDDGIQQIKDAVISYIGSDVTGGLSIGQKVYYYRLPEFIYSVQGVLDFELNISADGLTYNKENIAIGIREKAVTDYDKVVITT